jgi:hypothetical protein
MPPDVQGLLGWFVVSLVGGLCALFVGAPALCALFVVGGGYATAQYDDGLYRPESDGET